MFQDPSKNGYGAFKSSQPNENDNLNSNKNIHNLNFRCVYTDIFTYSPLFLCRAHTH